MLHVTKGNSPHHYAAVFDFDGVIANVNKVWEKVAKGKPLTQDIWDEYYEALKDPTVVEKGAAHNLLCTLAVSKMCSLYILTARTQIDGVLAFLKHTRVPDLQDITIIHRDGEDTDIAQFKVEGMRYIHYRHGDIHMLGYWEDSLRNIEAVEKEFPWIPTYRVLNHLDENERLTY